MIQILSTSQVVDALMSDVNANWSLEAAKALTEYLEYYEEDQGEQMELDIASIRCDYTEYPSLHHWAEEYYRNNDLDKEFSWDKDTDDDDKDEDIRNDIMEKGTLIEFNGGIIVSSF